VASPQEPGERPNPTRLDRAPGARYTEPDAGTTTEADATTADPAAAPARGIAWAVLVAIGGAAVIVALGGPLAVTVGLLVVAALIGRFVALALRSGAGSTIEAGAGTATAIAVAELAIVLGQVAIWLYARSEGGVLALPDYLAQTFGWLVPAQLIVAAAAAWWSAR
jgi:hypothetical protein